MAKTNSKSKKPEIEGIFLGRYICTKGGSDKFWEIKNIGFKNVSSGNIDNNLEESYEISYGRNGRGLHIESYIATRDEAWVKLLDKLRPEKGYELNSFQNTEALRNHIKLTRLAKKIIPTISAAVRPRARV